MKRTAQKRSIARRYFKSVSLVVISSMVLLAAIFLTLVSQYFRSENRANLSAAVQSVSKVMTVAETTDAGSQVMEAVLNRSADLAGEITGSTLLVTALLQGRCSWLTHHTVPCRCHSTSLSLREAPRVSRAPQSFRLQDK